ncbi:MAG TPA: ABC transporter permease [Thermoanaerobaculia bacterium]|nr:ABC transporter permease [Thermoanaerobaculia bacterium]
MLTSLLHDLRFAARGLVKWPGFSTMAILTLALGIGANTAIFSVINAVLLAPLPYPDAERLMIVWQTDRMSGSAAEPVSGPDFFDWREQSRSFAGMAAHYPMEFSLLDGVNDPERVSGGAVTQEFFSVLGSQPVIGRSFSPEEAQPGGEKVAVVSHSFWKNSSGADPSLSNRTIALDGVPHRVIGVMPPGFVSPRNPEERVWTPLQDTEILNNRDRHNLRVFARLAPAASTAEAQADMSGIATRLERQYPENKGRGARVEGLHESVVGDIRPALLVLMGAVVFVLLIACVNVANALLARALVRSREIVIRTALGAGRLRVIRQLLTESLLLALVGGALGLLLATWGLEVLKSLGASSIPRLDSLGIDARVFAFTAGVSLLTGITFGLLPALQLARPDLQAAIKAGGAGAGSNVSRRRLRAALVIVQVALAAVLTIGAGLLIRSFSRLQEVELGFNPQGLLKLDLSLPQARYPYPEDYPNWPQVARFYTDVLERLREVQGVESAAIGLNHPLKAGWTTQFTIEGRPEPPSGQAEEIRVRSVTPGYFQTVGQPLRSGRALTEQDNAQGPPVVLVNEAFVRRYFTNENPIGRKLVFWGTFEIVGVVGDVPFTGLASPVEPAMYPSLLQLPMSEVSLLVRTREDPLRLSQAVRHAVWSVDSELAPFDIATLEQLLAEATAQPRFNMLLLGSFAAVALVLAAMGIYGLMLFSVVHRTREIGIRMAMGADRRDVLKLIIGQGMLLLLLGLAIGLVISLGVTRLMASLLFGIPSYDWATFLTVSFVLATVGLIACCVPSLRASRIEPVVAIKCEG